MIVDLSLCKAQALAHRALRPGNTVALAWGRGLGKSWFIRLAWWLLVAAWDGKHRPGAPHPGIRIVLLMPTLEQARKVHDALTQIELEGEWAFLGGRLNRSSWRITFPGGSWIQWVTAERAHLLRGLRCDLVCVDEADDVSPELIAAITIPWFSEPHSLAMMLVGGTPRRGRHGLLYQAFKAWPTVEHWLGAFPADTHPGKAEEYAARHHGFHATGYDAPRIVKPEAMELAKGKTPEAIFKREWLCDFDSAEGLVFPMFSDRFHVREPPKDVRWSEIIVGADHGWEDPGVLLLIGVLGNGRDATAWVLDEVYEQHREPDWWIAKVREWLGWYPSALWYPDPARADICASWKRIGARIRDVDKSAGSVENGVGVLQRWLHVRTRPGEGGTEDEYARLYVSPSCVNLINEFGLYRRRRDARNTEIVLDDIEDANNHALDALRYAIVNRFEAGPSPKRHASAEERDT